MCRKRRVSRFVHAVGSYKPVQVVWIGSYAMRHVRLAALCAVTVMLLNPIAADSQALKRDIHGIRLGMTVRDVEDLKLKNCQAGSRTSLYCNDGQYYVRLSDKNRIYEITTSPCTTYTCKNIDAVAFMRQLEVDYGVRIEPSLARSYSGGRDDIRVGFSFSEDLWHIGITDRRIQMDDSSLK